MAHNSSVNLDISVNSDGYAIAGGTTSKRTFTLIGGDVQFTSSASSLVFSLPGASDTLVGIAAAQTLTNKTITNPIISAATTGAPAISFNSSAGTAPSSPASGNLWWDGTSLKFYTSSARVFLWADMSNVTGTVPVGNGGTNITSYSTGDMLYASGSTTLSKLAIGGVNGAIMMSNGSSAPSWVTTIPTTITFSNGATISGGTFTLNTPESCSLTVTGTAPTAGRADIDLWQPSGGPSTDFYAYYQQAEYANNQACTFGVAGLRSDVITTAALTSATLARADSMYAFYNPGGAGTVTQATGLRIGQASALSGTTTNYIGIRVENNVSSGTITNATGLYIDTIGGKGGTTGAAIYLVSDGTAKTGLSWGTSTSAYTADVGVFRSGAGTLTITGTATARALPKKR